MTGTRMPSPTGVRIAGDDYQWLHAWRFCLQARHQRITGHVANPIVAIGVEEPDVGNGDDIVLHRDQPPNTYQQVKYAVDHRTPMNLAYLTDQRILPKLVETHQRLTADGTPVEMALITNRTPDPTDVLLQDRDARDGRLVPRAAQGGHKSQRGIARAEWAAAAGTDEPTLMTFLADFRIDPAIDTDRVRLEVGLLMTANGLRSDPAAIDLGVDWIAKRVIAGHRLLTLDDIDAAITEMDLVDGSPWTTLSITTIKPDALSESAAVTLDWVDRMDGDSEWTRVQPQHPDRWETLGEEIRHLPARLAPDKRILLTGHIRQATGFLVGSELRRVKGYEVGVRQGTQLWTSEADTSGYDLTVEETPIGQGSDLAIVVNVATSITPAVLDWITRTALPIDNAIFVTPTTGAGPRTVPSATAANSLAVAIRDIARQHVRPETNIHLFLAGPLGVAVLLGHHWNRIATTRVYEHLTGGTYVPAFTILA